ncbi:sensor histidine kinase [Desertibacillus haloalkaliphilus]|uniref:sensor histidine kinase n=1 Tax=Desertibacillus haloalkaliphilus TaxID=1328930 RepID=UPI001C25B682|nr:sensor histidine kinase [Desertibacillus haloalkaliphilus]MBU8906634.1 sensor histidine kinase [Desertibacillus haloalkaliphilus]
MWELVLVMLERLGIIVTVAFVMTRFKFVRHLIEKRKIARHSRVSVIVMFGLFGIIGTYTGLKVNPEQATYFRWVVGIEEGEAIANSRVIGVVVAGLLGGWKVGIGAGLIAGVHRYFLGGFTAFACGLSTIIAGAIAGYFYKSNKNNRIISLQTALVVGMLAEAVQMGVILLVARPFDQALLLVGDIGVPMIIANGIGTAIFILIIRNVIHEEEKIGSLQAQKALKLADLTLKYLRKGLTTESALPTCKILLKEIQADAVSITNRERILAFTGVAQDHHVGNEGIRTQATKRVLKDGEVVIAGQDEINCGVRDCPLHAAIIAPLKIKEETIGTLKFYFKTEKGPSPTTIELSKGLSTLLSHQLELSEVDRHLELAKQAEIKALQAQVSPHFLFNALNTIIALIRTDPMKARRLLVSLSHFFRQNLSGTTITQTSIEEDLKHVKAYLEIEQARFSDKLTVHYDVDPKALPIKVPPMTLQPIVENAIKHGLKPLQNDSYLSIQIEKGEDVVLLSVSDNGIGMGTKRIDELGNERVHSKTGTGIGLVNINRRLQMMYGEKAGLNIESEKGRGTTVSFHIPLKVRGNDGYE